MHADELQDAEKLYRRLVLSYWDLHAGRVAERLREHQDGEVERVDELAKTVAAVVSYARPFSGNRPTEDTAPCLPEDYLSVLNERDLKLHRYLLKTRNNEFAHSDAEVLDLSAKISEFRGEKIDVPLGRNPMVPFGPQVTEHMLVLVNKLLDKILQEKARLKDQFEVGTEL